MGEWIWIEEKDESINSRCCFASLFRVQEISEAILLSICAVSRYMVYLNGEWIGRGPVRAAKVNRVFDEIDITSHIVEGDNYLAIRVWNYGLSNYQFVYEEPELNFEICAGDQVLVKSDENTKCCWDKGVISDAPKRNVNLGFSDYYDARRFGQRWICEEIETRNWGKAYVLNKRKDRIYSKNSISPWNTGRVYPERIAAIEEVKKGCKVYTLNLRRVFFGNRRDANETVFSGFLGGVFIASCPMEGVISFPNRAWNGIIGDFKIDGELYIVRGTDREKKVKLSEGEHFFLMEISGDYDDLYCHIELDFPEELQWKKLKGDKRFFTVGPISRLMPSPDGANEIYSGLNSLDRIAESLEEHEKIWGAKQYEKVGTSSLKLNFLKETDVYEDLYMLSLIRKERVVRQYNIRPGDCGILWNNHAKTTLMPPVEGDYTRIILDFGRACIGQLSFVLKATSGTVMDIYGFENYYRGEIDYTTGLNNGIHYVCCEGWQTYETMVRIGLRYVVITLRNMKSPVEIQDFHMKDQHYSVSNIGRFSCSDEELNSIFKMCKETNLMCTEDSFTDCPTYEQTFWTGDAYLSALIHSWLYGDYRYVSHNHELAISGFENTPLMNALTPTDWNTSIPMWAMNWMISIFDTAYLTGDDGGINEVYEYVVKVLQAYAGFIQEDGGLLIRSWNLLDWAPLDIHDYGVVTAQEGVLAYCFGLAAEYLERTHKTEKRISFAQYRQRLLEHIDEKLWNDASCGFYDGWTPDKGYSKTMSIQTHTLLYLYDGIMDPTKKKKTEDMLLHPPKEFVKAGSPFMLYFLYESYIKIGKQDDMIKDIKKRWRDMLSYDSTTCWEVFPGFYENGRTRSYCHSWSATPAYFMLKYVLGVKVLEAGCRKITFQPAISDLNWCRGAIPTPYGMIEVDWIKDAGCYDLRISLPEATEFVLPENIQLNIKIRRTVDKQNDVSHGYESV